MHLFDIAAIFYLENIEPNVEETLLREELSQSKFWVVRARQNSNSFTGFVCSVLFWLPTKHCISLREVGIISNSLEIDLCFSDFAYYFVLTVDSILHYSWLFRKELLLNVACYGSKHL